MLEPIVRKHLPRLQRVYDRFPAPARHVLTSARGWVLTHLRYSSSTFDQLRSLRTQDFLPRDEQQILQLRALQSAVNHALCTTPFYAAYPRVSIRAPEDLRQLPVLDRATALENAERLLSHDVALHRRILASTTGTTGTSLRVAYTEEVVRTNWAFLLRQWSWAGIEPRAPRVTLQGARIVPPRRTRPPFWTHNILERQILVSIFHLSEAAAPAYLKFLSRQRGKVLEGFPSVLGILADFVVAAGEPIPMRAVFTSGESLVAPTRAKIQRAFHAPVFDTYGMTEYCGLIQQCESGGMHLACEYGFLEILDARGNACPPGEDGDFVWTGFINPAMPLVRYRIGDRGCWQAGACPCGRSSPLVTPTITRESDILRLAGGRVFSPRALNQLLKNSSALRFCQFVARSPESVAIRAVPGCAGALDELMAIRAELQRLLGPLVRVTAELAAEPITRTGGKVPLIVNAFSPATSATPAQPTVAEMN